MKKGVWPDFICQNFCMESEKWTVDLWHTLQGSGKLPWPLDLLDPSTSGLGAMNGQTSELACGFTSLNSAREANQIVCPSFPFETGPECRFSFPAAYALHGDASHSVRWLEAGPWLELCVGRRFNTVGGSDSIGNRHLTDPERKWCSGGMAGSPDQVRILNRLCICVSWVTQRE